MTLEERVRITREKYLADPNYKPGPPKVVIDVIDSSNPNATLTLSGKSVSDMLANATNPKELRLLKRQIDNQLKPIQNAKIPSEINSQTIKMLPHIMRSKIESGPNRAQFLLECIAWEKNHPEEENYWSDKAIEVISVWVGVCENDKVEVKQIYELCKTLFPRKEISSDDKLNIASAFYLSSYLEYCFDLYYTIIICPYSRLETRNECCKFLYYSNDEKYVPAIEKHLTDIIESDADDDTRYECLASYVTTTGISSKFLSNILNISEVNQPLLTRLFLKFINTKCDLFYIIMSCEFLLEQKHDTSAYTVVCEKLLSIASDKSRDVRTRADAADVLLNHNIEPFSSVAQEIIQEIGESGQSELEKNIFTNKENVHYLNDTFSKFLVSSHQKYVGKMPKIQTVFDSIEQISSDLQEDSLFKIRQSLDRIMLEPTLHTERKISTGDIFRLIWTIIQTHNQKDELEKRFLEELEDMANTCSSGHAKRLVNVMVGFYDDLEGSVDIKDQFIANIKARLMACIRHDKNCDELLESMIGEKAMFNNFIMENKNNVEKELRLEFIDEGWLSEKKFNELFKLTIEKIVG